MIKKGINMRNSSPTKLSDFEGKDRDKIRQEISAKAGSLGFDPFENCTSYNKTKDFGLCNDCKHLQLVKSEFRTIFARCYDFEIRLHTGEPVTECTNYEQRNSLTLNQMNDLAYIIDVKQKEIGF